MKTILERFEDINLLTVDILNLEVNFLKNTLEVLRVTSQISNDAFLDAGIIQGGLSLISNLLEQGVSVEEANLQLSRLKIKSNALMETYPELDDMLESMR
ncbi:MAG: hypothetical protein HN533_06395 [Euryarchaeota archaeon]|jgi:hypothetical protein|nr:hypothetical protein [Euryarchaeota archaeon]MBT4802449.1 hypothetical protein [Euryarchaeota archaeon]MBT6874691.1 hypothetical protein [Euryarchaeota archaeon]MBT7413349.1 hypothetical protein [Euryarchaeota archaeon]